MILWHERIEVAQRLKEIKLMTQPEGAPLATAEATLVDPEALGNTSALERQISLLSTRIKSIAKHLQVFTVSLDSRFIGNLQYAQARTGRNPNFELFRF